MDELNGTSARPDLPWRPQPGLPVPELPVRASVLTTPVLPPRRNSGASDAGTPSTPTRAGDTSSQQLAVTPTPATAPPSISDTPVDLHATVAAMVAGMRDQVRRDLRSCLEATTALIAALRSADVINTPLRYFLHRLEPNIALLSKAIDALLALAVAGPRYSSAATEGDVISLLDQWVALRRTSRKVLAFVECYQGMVAVFSTSSLVAGSAAHVRGHRASHDGSSSSPASDRPDAAAPGDGDNGSGRGSVPGAESPDGAPASTKGRSVAATLSLLNVLERLPSVQIREDVDGVITRVAVREIWRACASSSQPVVRLKDLLFAVGESEPAGSLADLDLRAQGLLANRVCCLPDVVTVFQVEEWTAARGWLASLRTACLPPDALGMAMPPPPMPPRGGTSRASVASSNSIASTVSVPSLLASASATNTLVSHSLFELRDGNSVPSTNPELATFSSLPLEAIVPHSIHQLETVTAIQRRVNEQLDQLDEALNEIMARRRAQEELAQATVPQEALPRVLLALDRDTKARSDADHERRLTLYRLAVDLMAQEAVLLANQRTQTELATYAGSTKPWRAWERARVGGQFGALTVRSTGQALPLGRGAWALCVCAAAGPRGGGGQPGLLGTWPPPRKTSRQSPRRYPWRTFLRFTASRRHCKSSAAARWMLCACERSWTALSARSLAPGRRRVRWMALS